MNQPRHARRAGAVKGRALLLFRLARQDIRHHFAQAVLLVVAIAAATTVLRPVHRLGEAARRLGEGKLDTRLRVSGTDELEELATPMLFAQQTGSIWS